MFAKLLLKTIASSLKDQRVHTYKEPKLATPEFGAAHRKYKDRVYKTYAVIHILDYLNFADEVAKHMDSSKWSKQERYDHLQEVVGKHRRRVR